jgi:hypothetical protein
MEDYTQQDIDDLEENIKENVEYLSTTQGDEYACITLENLEGLLTTFFGTKIKLRTK